MGWQAFPGEWHLGAAVLLLALVFDCMLGEPPDVLHPVVWMGKLIALLERLFPMGGNTASLLAGAGIALFVPALFGLAAWLAVQGLRELGTIPYLLGGALLLKTTFSVKGLGEAAQVTRRFLAAGNLNAARRSLERLVSRDTQKLDEPLVAAAAIESVGENTTDSYIAPWLAFALLGLPGAFAYRAVNTLDSMIGYHGKYEYSGKAAAKLDDLVNLVPARLSASLLLAAGLFAGLSQRVAEPLEAVSVRRGWKIMRRDHGLTESPNAGWTMSAMSGLIGVALEKPGHYLIGNGLRRPGAADIGRAVRLAYLTAALGVLTTLCLLVMSGK
ncbi:MAG: adenosylcobinamide-phosphate synthase CbiB [Gammaproteobacteria bacterium]|nr:adenosylcobinamide-phosphate synthase CbiB [Gammaproteobacteria bacterium]